MSWAILIHRNKKKQKKKYPKGSRKINYKQVTSYCNFCYCKKLCTKLGAHSEYEINLFEVEEGWKNCLENLYYLRWKKMCLFFFLL